MAQYHVQAKQKMTIPGCAFREWETPKPDALGDHQHDGATSAAIQARAYAKTHPSYYWRVLDILTGNTVLETK